MAKVKQTTKPMQTCADCVNESACKLWTCGRVLADENAARCPEFKTVKDTASYLIGKLDGEKAALSGAWIPVTPETMPPYEKKFGNTTGDLLLQTLWNGYVAVYAGYYHDGRWWTYMETGTEVLSEGTFVTHWMPLEKLLKGAEENG